MSKSPKNKLKSNVGRYGWTPDLPDHRDHVYAATPLNLMTLPPKIDLRPKCPAVYDQGPINSCTANAIAAAIDFDRLKQGLPDFTPSRLFIYYNERDMEHKVAVDAGAQIRNGIKSIASLGAPPEKDWPYVPTSADDKTHLWPPGAPPAEKPAAAAFQNALLHKSINYQRVNRDLPQLKGCLASGYPFVLGFSAYTGFESPVVAKTGTLNLPAANESLVDGHCVLAVGYDESQQRFIIRNSWGPHWGLKGYFTMPYNYLLTNSLSRDFWTIRVVE